MENPRSSKAHRNSSSRDPQGSASARPSPQVFSSFARKSGAPRLRSETLTLPPGWMETQPAGSSLDAELGVAAGARSLAVKPGTDDERSVALGSVRGAPATDDPILEVREDFPEDPVLEFREELPREPIGDARLSPFPEEDWSNYPLVELGEAAEGGAEAEALAAVEQEFFQNPSAEDPENLEPVLPQALPPASGLTTGISDQPIAPLPRMELQAVDELPMDPLLEQEPTSALTIPMHRSRWRSLWWVSLAAGLAVLIFGVARLPWSPRLGDSAPGAGLVVQPALPEASSPEVDSLGPANRATPGHLTARADQSTGPTLPLRESRNPATALSSQARATVTPDGLGNGRERGAGSNRPSLGDPERSTAGESAARRELDTIPIFKPKD